MRALALLFLLLAAAPGLVSPGQAQERFQTDSLEVQTATGRHRFTVELAITPAQQAQGLMFRRQMPADHGMLFPYHPPQPAAFWMRNTYLPLDMVFIGPDRRVTGIAERTVPLSEATVPSPGPVIGVLELNGGTARRIGLKPGDTVIWRGWR